MVGVVDRIGTEKGHDEGFHNELESHAERNAHRESPCPTARCHEAELAPWRKSEPRPHEHEYRPDGGRTGKWNDHHGEEACRSEAAQARHASTTRVLDSSCGGRNIGLS